MSRNRIRCAIYTRKSSEEGLEQDFNSLDAQREACEAYVLSQKHEGWVALTERYDDGGISGATMERPALKRLLADVEAGRIDAVVVYKVDRLTRSLGDFARIVDIFDRQNVSFVSVTQQFNTTTSMGRLTLNMLLSFAQFEREVTAERIRDKIAASKKKGMWMGGIAPIGYEAKDRSLIVEPESAETVRTVFRLYLELGCVRKVEQEAFELGLTTRVGRPISRGHIYQILNNPIYIGQIRHKDQRYPGLHEAIIDRKSWDAVQAKLAENRIERSNGTHAREPSMLAGKLFDNTGQPFTPSHAVKQGRRYRYYIERSCITGRTGGRTTKKTRIAAGEIEGVVTRTVFQLLRSPSELIAAIGLTRPSVARTGELADAGADLADRLDSDYRLIHPVIRSLVARVVLAENEVHLHLDRPSLHSVLEMEPAEPFDAHHVVKVPVTLHRRGVELRFAIEGSPHERAPETDPSLIKAIVRGHDWWNRLLSGDVTSIADIARAEGVTGRYVRRLIELAFLAPDITSAILDGHQPVDLTAQRLTNPEMLPLDWAEQRTSLRIF